MRILAATILLSLSSCSVKSIYPIVGATIGGSGGALLGGPGGAAVGAFGGNAVGHMLKSEKEVEELEEKVEELSRGDVLKLLDEQKGWFGKTIEGVYDLLKLGGFVTLIYFIFHFWYGRYFVKKLNNNKK